MNIRLTTILTIVTCFAVSVLSAQRQANHWHFGDSISINFTSGSPQLDPPSGMTTLEGSAAQSDEQGNLLFYTNGGGYPAAFDENTGFIWNRDHEIMYDMEGIEGGNNNAAQSAIVFPVPGEENNRYYLFTMEETDYLLGGSPPDQPLGRGLSYFIVDMNLNGGLGGVEIADERVFVPAYEGLTAIAMRGSTEGYWVITHNLGLNWVVVPVTASGVGEPIIYPLAIGELVEGIIKGSPDGNWLLNEKRLFSFDPVTGIPANSSSFSFGDISDLSSSFTPDSRFLFSIRSGPAGQALTRFDLTAADIEASAAILAIIEPETFVFQMEIGPNGSLYFLESKPIDGFYTLSEISCPSTDAPTLNRQILEFPDVEDPFTGLPNYPPDIFQSLASQEDTLVVFNDTVTICPQEDAIFLALDLGDTYSWSTGSSDSLIQVTMAGNYSVTITGGCQVTVENFVLDVRNDTIRIINDSFLVCPQTEVQLIPQTEATGYQWSNGSTAPFIEVSVPGDYHVTITGDCEPKVESYYIANLPEITGDIVFLSDTSLLCAGQDSIVLTYAASEVPESINWIVTEIGTNLEDAFNTDTITLPVSEFGQNIELNLLGECGFVRRFYTYVPAPGLDPQIEISVEAPERLCPGDEIALTVVGVTNEVAVFWEDGSNGSFRTIGSADSSINYFATIVNNCNDSLRLDVELDYSDCPIECEAAIPELITPNNDGINDIFRLFSNCLDQVEEFQLLIFNRWGQPVFDSTNPLQGWDGELNGEPQAMDVYLYRIRYKFRDEMNGREQDGQFSLVR
ncbi:hypothetical protein CEQ90_14600 [Lewinellaceae bacterium SD302]|nr:hypothetical protein CEQ90_14600 [Lewinellaceae bacterium SD302]